MQTGDHMTYNNAADIALERTNILNPLPNDIGTIRILNTMFNKAGDNASGT